MSAGRTFAAMPKSTRHISPGSVLFVLCFHGVEHLEPLQRPLVTLGQSYGFLFCSDDAAHDFPSCFVRLLRYFRDDFRSAHVGKIHGKRESVNILHPAAAQMCSAKRIATALDTAFLRHVAIRPSQKPAKDNKSDTIAGYNERHGIEPLSTIRIGSSTGNRNTTGSNAGTKKKVIARLFQKPISSCARVFLRRSPSSSPSALV
jgi:hypothetical protein